MVRKRIRILGSYFVSEESASDTQELFFCYFRLNPKKPVCAGFLAVLDASTLGEFRKYAIQWQLSPACEVAGFFGVLSSELSVFTLGRYIGSYPIYEQVGTLGSCTIWPRVFPGVNLFSEHAQGSMNIAHLKFLKGLKPLEVGCTSL